jgi:hypothetical protein
MVSAWFLLAIFGAKASAAPDICDALGLLQARAEEKPSCLEALCPNRRVLKSLSEPLDIAAPPRCWQLRLSRTNAELQAKFSSNPYGQVFPETRPKGHKLPYCRLEDVERGEVDGNCYCPLRLGQEYGFDSCEELAVTDFTAKTMAMRQLEVGAYDTAGACPSGQLGGPNCCGWTGFQQPENQADLCMQWPNNIAWNGMLLSDNYSNNANLPGKAQFAGCQGGTDQVPGKAWQTYCQNANDFWKIGCSVTGENCSARPKETMYIYNLPAFPLDGSPRVTEPSLQATGFNVSVTETRGHVVYGADLPPQAEEGFGPGPQGQPFGDWQWAFKQNHGKGYTCLNARVKFLDTAEETALNRMGINTVPKEFRFGLFKKFDELGQQYPAFVRLAGNRNHTLFDWHDGRVNGLSIKIYDAEQVTGQNGENRIKISGIPRDDYAKGDAPIKAPYHNPKQYRVTGIPKAKKGFSGRFESFQNETTIDLTFIAVRGQYQQGCKENSPKCLWNIFAGSGDARCHSPEFLYGTKLEWCRKQDPSVRTHATWNALNYTYGSASAYKLGNNMAMKMMTQPCGPDESDNGKDYWASLTNNVQSPAHPNFKAANVKDTMMSSDMQLCVWVQLQENPCTEPIENSAVKWNTPLRLVGRVYIGKGVTPVYNDECDNTVFNPYRTLPDHMPLGSINRIRHAAYAYASNFRLLVNFGRSRSEEELGATILPLVKDQPPGVAPVPPEIPARRCPYGFGR